MKKIISVMAVWDEQNMIALSIESTKDIIYEYIVVIKKGTDKTRQVLEHCKKVWGLRMKIIETELKLREARALCFKMAEKYADYYLIQDGDEIYFTTKELQEMGRQTILDLIEEDYDHCSGCMIYLKHDLRNTGDNLTWLIEHPFLIKNVPEVYWPNYGDLPYINCDWSKRNYKHFLTGNKTHPFKFDCNIKNYRRLFLRQIFTPWHDGNNTCTIEEYCLNHYRPCLDYKKDVRETDDIEEIIMYYQETDPSYQWCKRYDENEYYVYPSTLKRYIEGGFLRGIEEIQDLQIMVSNSSEDSRKALVDRIAKLENNLESVTNKREYIDDRLKHNLYQLEYFLETQEDTTQEDTNEYYGLVYLFEHTERSILEDENAKLTSKLRNAVICQDDTEYILEGSLNLLSKLSENLENTKTLAKCNTFSLENESLDIINELEGIEKDVLMDVVNQKIEQSMYKINAAYDKIAILEYKIEYLKKINNDLISNIISEIIYEQKYIDEVNNLSKKIVNDATNRAVLSFIPLDLESDIESETLSIRSISETDDIEYVKDILEGLEEEPERLKDKLLIETQKRNVLESDDESLDSVESEELEESAELLRTDDLETDELYDLEYDREDIEKYCIVYSKSKKRLENYNQCKKNIPELIYREAVDSVTNYDVYKNIAVSNGLLTEAYIDGNFFFKGKLGCNLSHMYLLDDLVNNENGVEWALVIEDDVEIRGYDKDIINRLIQKANEYDSHFIQLYTNERFIEEQKKTEKVDKNLYRMIPQWGTVAYLISKTGAKRVIESYPLAENIDGVYSKHCSTLRALCYLNKIFINKGDADATKGGELGSIIWGTAVSSA